MKCKSILSLTLILSLIVPYTVSVDPSFASEIKGQNTEVLRKRRNYPYSNNGRNNRNRRGTEVNRVNTRTSRDVRRLVIQRVNSGRNQNGTRVTNVQRVNTRTSRDGRRRVIQRVNSGRNQDGKRYTNVERVDTRTSRDGRRREINRINYPNDNNKYRNRRDNRNYRRDRDNRDRNIRHIIRRDRYDRYNRDQRYDENRNNRNLIKDGVYNRDRYEQRRHDSVRRRHRNDDYYRNGTRIRKNRHRHRRNRDRDIIIINSPSRYGYFDSYSHRTAWRNRRYIINPRNRWINWGWNNGDRWYPNDNYWGGGFWGNFLLEALARGIINSIVYSGNNNNNYPAYVTLQPNSPGYYLFDSYGLTQAQCDDQEEDLVYVYGPQDTLVCAYPTETVIAGSYDADPQDLILVLRD